MIDIAISYFYHVRFFKPYMIPISTAVFDPKWYHDFKGQQHVFIDKNGVINGLRIDPLRPPSECENLCRGREGCSTRNPVTCEFMQKYSQHLNSLNFDDFLVELHQHCMLLKQKLKLDRDPLAVLLVHEKYDNPCSERIALIEWFEVNGLNVRELKYPVQFNY